MTVKEFIASIFSRKSSVVAVAIVALVYIATVSPGQLSVDAAGVTMTPMSPALPPAEQAVDWKIPAEITLIACLAIFAQAALDYYRPRNKKVIDIDLSKITPPDAESLN